jgi:hypothetical protein
MTWRDDHYLTIECDGCGENTYVPNYKNEDKEKSISAGEFQQIDNGWCLDFTGGYGMFTDDISGNRHKHVSLCHDCCVKIAQLFPRIFETSGYHSVDYRQLRDTDNRSCCEYAWTSIDDELYVGDGKGGWKKRSELPTSRI